MAERKGALLSGSTASIQKDYGYIVEPKFNNNGTKPSIPTSGELSLKDLAKFNPAWQAKQTMEAKKGF